MPSDDLSPRRQQILDCIVSTTRDRGYPPTVREIGQAVGLTSSSSVHFHLRALEKTGYLERDGSLTRALRPRPFRHAQPSRYVPLVGKVAAGEPILAQQNIEEAMPLPEGLFPDGDLFLLRVRGDSMINAGIMDGDLVVVKRQQSADNGDIIVALLDEEATVKRFFQHSHAVELRPENEALEPIITREAQILGRVCGVIRSYQ
ncbi:transcriptional repressor LexA [bacterium]|nr:transcriptional repressor LexA [bacterium]